MKKTTVTGLEEKWEVVLVYIVGLLGFIFSFMKYDYLSDNIKFHYRQAGTMWLIYIVAGVLGKIMNIAVVSYAVSCIYMVLLVFIIITIVKSFEGTKYEIPVIADLSKKIFGEE